MKTVYRKPFDTREEAIAEAKRMIVELTKLGLKPRMRDEG